MLPSVGLWLNASKPESMLESDETFRLLERELSTHRAFYVFKDHMTGHVALAKQAGVMCC